MHPIHTVGHSTHAAATLGALLARHAIALVADVRSAPYSRRHPQHSKDELARWLADAGVGYLFLGAELGARPRDPACYEAGRVSFARLAAQPAFRRGVERVLALAEGRRVALLCAEGDPLRCHRSALVCRHLGVPPGAIRHILPTGECISHAELEARLVEAGGGAQPDLFASGTPAESAWRRLEAEIAYARS